ncbi:hypothetical protein [Marivita sp. GX14005]|uniref:hypothetical protein n=1 Tax=Marivita sp. GX14005 TaxID=2942276 RepID=UPI002019B219|nr:hypothetical protein [Marivita sp. GX14005]MCL3881004.1 hypothetical protein [Marivita sp. GX14005]
MRELAGQAVLQGRPELAYDLSGALISRDSNDLNAQLIRSRSARDLGYTGKATAHAKAAWALSRTPSEKYASSLAMAQALSSAGRRTSAQLWLRRAVHHAPSDALKARAARDFRYVRSQNPWSTAFSFSVAPSSNINNGSRNETSELFGLPFEFQLEGEARALSGVEVSTGFRARYRLMSTPTRRRDLSFRVSHRTYQLSDDAKDIAPDVEGSDFATSSVFAGISESHALSALRAQARWDLGIGGVWYGGDPLFHYNRAGIGLTKPISKDARIDLGLTREGQIGQGRREDATIWSARLGYDLTAQGGDRFAMSVGLTRSSSDGDYLDYTQRDLSLRYALARPIGPALLDFGVTLSDKNHDRSAVSMDGRDERSIEASITAAFPGLDAYGFIPTVTFNAERTDANIDLYETENYGIQLGIRSVF